MVRKLGSKNMLPVLKSKIIDLSRAGHAATYIANFYEVSKNTVKGMLRRSKLNKTPFIKKKAGRKHKLEPECVFNLLKYVHSNNNYRYLYLLLDSLIIMVRDYRNGHYVDI